MGHACEQSFQSDKFLVIPCASSRRTLYSGGTRELLYYTGVDCNNGGGGGGGGGIVSELTARFIGRLMALIPGTEWQPPES